MLDIFLKPDRYCFSILFVMLLILSLRKLNSSAFSCMAVSFLMPMYSLTRPVHAYRQNFQSPFNVKNATFILVEKLKLIITYSQRNKLAY